MTAEPGPWTSKNVAAQQPPWRVGRTVGRTVYVQVGDDPAKGDVLIGVMDTPELAALVVRAVNEHLWSDRPNAPVQPERISMSWSIRCPSQTAATIDAAGRAAYADYRATYQADPGEVSAMDEQVEAALTAAQALLDSGAVGTGACLVSLSGHANPDHAKRKGWSNDRIVITVEQH